MKLSLLKLLSVVCLVIIIGSCSSSSTDTEDPEFDRGELLRNFAENIISPAYVALQEEVDDLEAAINTFNTTPNATNLQNAQNALRDARLAWQDANIFQFGPAESATLRAVANIYPTDTDKIDTNVNTGNYVLGTLANINAGGFPALDYLLNGTGANNTEILEQFTTDQNAANRLTYLTDNIDLIKAAVDNTTNAWSAGAGSYRETFLSAANSGVDVGSSLGLLINALALHYERFLRDGKVGIPAGVRSAGIARPRTTEAFYSGNSRELAIANLRSVLRLFLGTSLSGTDGVGLAENLEFLEATELSTSIQAELNEAIAAIEALSDPLSDNISNDNAAVLAAFAEMQQVVVLIKADLASTLGISITFQDNDGD